VANEHDLGDLFQSPDAFWRAQQRRIAAAEELQRRIQAAVGTATSDDERITVSYSEANGVEELTLDPRALRAGSEELATRIRQAVNGARADAREQIATLVREAAKADGVPDPQDVLAQVPDFEKTMEEVLRDTEEMGQQLTDIVERMRRIADG